MNEPAAFRATFSDWKLIRTRKVVQLVFEVPIEAADHAYTVLGGMPDPGKSVWCAVARLNGKEGDAAHEPAANRDRQGEHIAPPGQSKPAGRAKRSWDELSAAERAGIRCKEPAFQRFLREEYDDEVTDEDTAAHLIKGLCSVRSRADIKPGTDAFDAWNDIDNDYRIWQLSPVVVG